MQRDEQRRRSRAAILDAAGSQFEQHGYAATSLADVAGQLGMVRGTVHFHFATKDGLAQALAEHLDEVWARLVAETVDATPDRRAGLVEFSHRFVDVLATDARVRGALRVAREHPNGSDDLPGLARRWVELVASTLDTGRAGDAELIAAAVLGIADLGLLGTITDVHARLDSAWRVLPR